MVKHPHYHRDKRRAMHALFAPLDPKRGAEIGVWNGRTSRSLLKHFPKLTLYMVDSWSKPSPGDSWYESGDRFAKRSVDEFAEAYQCAMECTFPYDDRRNVLYFPSTVSASHVANESLDFVFIDGDHSFDGTRNDIHAWHEKVRLGGIISGHDYGQGEEQGYGVADAVKQSFDEFEVIEDAFIWHTVKQ